MARALALVIPIASACAYAPGSFSGRSSSGSLTSFPGARATVGCLDVAVGLTGDAAAGPVIEYTIGNRCDRATVVDLRSVRVRSATGIDLGPLLQPHDPRLELRPLWLEARSVVTERIEYRHVQPAVGSGLCADVGSLNGVSADRWLCQEGTPTPIAPALAGGVP